MICPSLNHFVATMLDGKPIISLPPKTVSLKTVDFTNEERSFYNTLEVESREQFKVSSQYCLIVLFRIYSSVFVTQLDLWILHLDIGTVYMGQDKSMSECLNFGDARTLQS